MGASSVTGVGQTSARKRIAYRDEESVSNVDLNPKVVAAGLLTLDGSGAGSVPFVDFYGTLVASCDSGGCSWNATVEIAVGTSYQTGDADYAAIRWQVLCDDPVFSRSQLLSGTAQKPACLISFSGEPNATISYIVSTTGNRHS
jgi:hypothetical protein